MIVAELAEHVISNTGGPRFESSYQWIFQEQLFTVNCIVKTKKEKEDGNGPFFKKAFKQSVRIISH